ncbi:hypothetical protein F6X51_08155 [Methylobacterium planeticum]|uniref:Uncharacterized protein n=1 Tax=Methylobacterium planeticum TaxID=2615211 RepID=A0A6N6MV60_9HYPH|nr:hypothetical protein F6X51_08155 [Methylobacterium planeticum]
MAGPAAAEAQKAAPAKAAAAPDPSPVVGCPSLANLRLLLRQSQGDAGLAAARLADEKADHLGCGVLSRDKVSALADHVALDGQAYDCIGLQGTQVCQWTRAGAVTPVKPPPAEPPRRPAPDKLRR